MSSTNFPLWKAMHDSAIVAIMRPAGLRATSARQEAARLRAIADEIEKRWTPVDYLDEIQKEIIYWLRREADQAEAGN